jgi:rhodanese-related sulfurtransferase
MKKLIVLGLLSAVAMFAQDGSAPKQATAKQKQAPVKVKKLTRAELDQLLANQNTLLLDVRRPDEVSTIGGFPVYLSIQVTELEKHLNEIPKDRLIVTVSNHASRAGKAADLLDSKGFKVAGAVGVEDYEAEGGKITRIEIPKQQAAAKQ